MDYDILKSVSQGSDGAQDAENSRIAAIADELRRLCQLHEAQPGTGQAHVTPFEREQRMAALGFEKADGEGRFSNGSFLVWDLIPRNVLVDRDGDIFVVDAEIKRI